ncbi:hypothetical protein [Mycolicibacterium arenosum]|uniref:Uncharacterized protein n=1 Tax=Mycolicibacterium arenosum TaxID=2952157 RepID=A0ABT1M7L0_9MYCO|nr:hypothetical protein [Mycolicibacterium sp. CAU 1645]MCP9275164.1 hypothetical protein [Mycolicibacterium sp. CAU 1645]
MIGRDGFALQAGQDRVTDHRHPPGCGLDVDERDCDLGRGVSVDVGRQ